METYFGNTEYNVDSVQPFTMHSDAASTLPPTYFCDNTTISPEKNILNSGYHSGGLNLGVKGNGGTHTDRNTFKSYLECC